MYKILLIFKKSKVKALLSIAPPCQIDNLVPFSQRKRMKPPLLRQTTDNRLVGHTALKSCRILQTRIHHIRGQLGEFRQIQPFLDLQINWNVVNIILKRHFKSYVGSKFQLVINHIKVISSWIIIYCNRSLTYECDGRGSLSKS